MAARKSESGKKSIGVFNRPSSFGGAGALPRGKANAENTYQMEPRRKFKSYMAKRIAKTLVDKRFNDGTKYSSDQFRDMSKAIAAEMLQALKALRYERYRYVVQVHAGQKRWQGVQVSSRALVDPANDTFAEYLFENKCSWCVVTVHAVYYE